jgi:hypothetical protein
VLVDRLLKDQNLRLTFADALHVAAWRAVTPGFLQHKALPAPDDTTDDPVPSTSPALDESVVDEPVAREVEREPSTAAATVTIDDPATAVEEHKPAVEPMIKIKTRANSEKE